MNKILLSFEHFSVNIEVFKGTVYDSTDSLMKILIVTKERKEGRTNTYPAYLCGLCKQYY